MTRPAAPPGVALVYDAVYPFTLGGVEHRADQVARRLVGRRAVAVYGFRYWGVEAGRCRPGVRYVSIGRPRLLHGPGGKRRLTAALAAALGTARALWTSRESVWDVANIPYFPVPAAWVVGRLRRRPLVVTWHEFWGDHWAEYLGSRWKGWLARRIERLALRCSPVAIAVSPHTRDRMIRAGYPADRVHLIPNGVEVEAIARLAPAPGGADLVYAGRLTPHKQVDLAIRAFAALRRRRPELTFWMIGDGPSRAALEQLAAELGVADAVRFHGFVPDEADVFGRMKVCKVAVLPSRREGFGLAAVQAWACGLPVVVCDEPENAMTGLVAGPLLGRVVPSDADALAAACDELLGEDTPAARAARVDHARNYDLDRMVAALEAVYDAAARTTPRGNGR